MRDLSKPIARFLSLRVHPWLILAGCQRFHWALLRRFPGARIVGSETLILTTRGRSRGQPSSTPVDFVRGDDRLSEEEAAGVWSLLVATYHPFARYQQRTRRRIPVIELSPVSEHSPAWSFALSPARKVVPSHPKGARSCR